MHHFLGQRHKNMHHDIFLDGTNFFPTTQPSFQQEINYLWRQSHNHGQKAPLRGNYYLFFWLVSHQ